MPELKANLTEKDKLYRDLALEGNVWRVAFQVGIPMALYQGFLMAFRLADNAIAAHISSEAVSATAIIFQIIHIVQSLGSALAVGATMKIAQSYGAGDYLLVKQRISSAYAICAFVGVFILAISIPFSRQILSLSGTPEHLIEIGNDYFRVDMFAAVISIFNMIYLSVERVRGNAKRILYINVIISSVKLCFTACFVYLLNGDVVTIAYATLISQGLLFIFAVVNMRGRDNAFGFSFAAIKMSRKVSGIIVTKSIPVMIERVAFSIGKVVVNAMSAIYKDNTVGALSVSNNICGIPTSLCNGFQEAGAALISQNRGAGNKKRAIDVFKKIFIINSGLGLAFFILTMWQLDFLSGLFSGGNEEFRLLIKSIYSYEAFAAVALGMNAAVLSLLYGFGLTKLSLLVNASRVLVFRIPLLWFLQNFTDIGNTSVGIVMMVSNILTGILSVIVAIVAIRKFKREE
ncbi:MAG: MATE family efflux transporter [Oscillospiraceae bacterium]|nr:MATE family efflux transporter [Oscillospiraceae bacterium]